MCKRTSYSTVLSGNHHLQSSVYVYTTESLPSMRSALIVEREVVLEGIPKGSLVA